MEAAEAGLGLAVVPDFLVDEPLQQGRLVELLPDFPVTSLWFKALVPNHKTHRPEIVAFLKHLKQSFDPPPWDGTT